MPRLLTIVGGVSFLLLGLRIIIKGGFWGRFGLHYFDFSEAPLLAGGVFLLMGSVLVWIGIKKKEEYFEGRYFMCPKCKEPFRETDVPDFLCPKCGGEVEKLEGFYERHPELRNEDN